MALRKPDGWRARSDQERVNLFASHLNAVFTPHDESLDNSTDVNLFLNECHQLELSIPKTFKTEIIQIIKTFKNNKASDYDLIQLKILKELPSRAIEFLQHIFNACLSRYWFSDQGKEAEIGKYLGLHLERNLNWRKKKKKITVL